MDKVKPESGEEEEKGCMVGVGQGGDQKVHGGEDLRGHVVECAAECVVFLVLFLQLDGQTKIPNFLQMYNHTIKLHT